MAGWGTQERCLPRKRWLLRPPSLNHTALAARAGAGDGLAAAYLQMARSAVALGGPLPSSKATLPPAIPPRRCWRSNYECLGTYKHHAMVGALFKCIPVVCPQARPEVPCFGQQILMEEVPRSSLLSTTLLSMKTYLQWIASSRSDHVCLRVHVFRRTSDSFREPERRGPGRPPGR